MEGHKIFELSMERVITFMDHMKGRVWFFFLFSFFCKKKKKAPKKSAFSLTITLIALTCFHTEFGRQQ